MEHKAKAKVKEEEIVESVVTKKILDQKGKVICIRRRRRDESN